MGPPEKQTSALFNLPGHVIEHICKYLPQHDCANLAGTCQLMLELAKNARIFARFHFSVTAGSKFDPGVPARCHMRTVAVTGSGKDVATALTSIADAGSANTSSASPLAVCS